MTRYTSVVHLLLSDDADNAAAKDAYQSLLRVTLTMPEDQLWQNFTQRVRLRAMTHYNYSYDEPVNAMTSSRCTLYMGLRISISIR